MRTDSEVQLHRVWAATKLILGSCALRVAENRDVMGALDFAHYVLNSGLIELCEANKTGLEEEGGGLVVDCALLREMANDVRRACQLRFSTNNDAPTWEAMELQSLHEKLDKVLNVLAVTGGPVSAWTPAAVERRLKVISGGLARKGRGAGRLERRTAAG